MSESYASSSSYYSVQCFSVELRPIFCIFMFVTKGDVHGGGEGVQHWAGHCHAADQAEGDSRECSEEACSWLCRVCKWVIFRKLQPWHTLLYSFFTWQDLSWVDASSLKTRSLIFIMLTVNSNQVIDFMQIKTSYFLSVLYIVSRKSNVGVQFFLKFF